MTASDIPKDGWVDRWLPTGLRPYARLARLDRPIGTWLLLLPCWWSLALAWRADPSVISMGGLLWLYMLFGAGALVMRGAGCTINDLYDRDIDVKVARTSDRPIAIGAVSVPMALLFLAVQMAIGLLILLQLNEFSRWLGIAVLGLVFTYPLFKRITYWPQAVLGLTFNWGALLGWAAVNGELSWPPVILYAAGFAWTLGYDTIYAHQDKEDDVLVGVKSSALALGARTSHYLYVFYAVALVGITTAGMLAGLEVWFLAVMVAGAGHFYWQVRDLDTENSANCHAKFLSNRDFGLIVAAAILVG